MRTTRDNYQGIQLTGLLLLLIIGLVGVVVGFILVTKPLAKEICRYNTEIGEYEVYTDKWRVIMLPDTQPALTFRTYKGGQWTDAGKTEYKQGHPKQLKEVDQGYLREVKVTRRQRVTNGDYCVERLGKTDNKPMWTVWTPELFNAVRKEQGW